MKIYAATIALFVVSTSAFAADLSPQSVEPIAPVVAPAFNWTGFYAGVHAGAVFGNSELLEYKVKDTAFIGGAHAGYNLQLNSNVVIGVEGDIDYTSLSENKLVRTLTLAGPRDSVGYLNNYVKPESEWQGSVRARLGYAFDRLLPYVTGGVAFGDERVTYMQVSNVIESVSYSSTKTAVGWTVGGGVEYAIDDHWVARGEVRYTDFGKPDLNFSIPNNDGLKSSFNEVSTTLGVSYKF